MSSLAQTLRAAAADEGIAGRLGAGLLLREPAAPSIGDLLGSLPASPSRAPAAVAEPDAKQAAEEARDEQRGVLRDQVATARSEAMAARRAERAAAAAARKLHDEWERAQALADEAVRRSEAAEQRLEELRREL